MSARVGISRGMSGYYAIVYEADGPVEILYTGCGRYREADAAIEEARDIAIAEDLPCDYPLVNENQKTKQTNTVSEELKIRPIKTILDKSEHSDGDVIKKISGKITKLFPINKGGDGDSKYEYQNGEFEGDDGGKIRICFSKCSQSDAAKGKKVTINSVKTDQFGWQGIKVLDKEYEEDKDGETVKKMRRELRITPSAQIEYQGGAPSGGTSSGSGGSTKGEKSEKPSTGTSSQQTKPTFDGHPKPFLEDLVALHYDVANLVNERYNPDPDKMPKIDVSAFIATIFIEAAKNGLAYDYKARAAKPVPVKYPPAPTDPKQWKECVMPWGKDDVKGKKLSELTGEQIKVIHKYFDDKSDNSALAECVYQAAIEMDLFKAEREQALREEQEKAAQQADDRALDAQPDDIPF